MYADPDQQARTVAREAGRRDMLEQRADDAQDDIRELTREELMQARVRQLLADVRGLATNLTHIGNDVNATRDAFDWLRMIEASVSDALSRTETFARKAQPSKPLL